LPAPRPSLKVNPHIASVRKPCSPPTKRPLHIDIVLTASLLRRDELERQICTTLSGKAIESITDESTDAQIATYLDDACTGLNQREGVDCQPFLDAHEDELIAIYKHIRGAEESCLAIEVCTVNTLPED
jgi:hypothetical protein